MLIAVINESTLVTNDQVNLMCQAMQTQLNLHVLPAWNMKAGTVTFYADKKKVPGYAWLVSILDDPTIANALGYHSEDNNRVDGFIFVKTIFQYGGKTLYDVQNPQNMTVSSVLSHEICEMVGDRFANFWADGPSITQGSEYALELCDPVEGDSYTINVGGNLVSVSNFVFPSWFNPQAVSPLNKPFDYMNKLSAPFTMTKGGYMIVAKAGAVSQVFGETMPDWKKEMKKAAFSRNKRKRK